jgi:hypothetical protein
MQHKVQIAVFLVVILGALALYDGSASYLEHASLGGSIPAITGFQTASTQNQLPDIVVEGVIINGKTFLRGQSADLYNGEDIAVGVIIRNRGNKASQELIARMFIDNSDEDTQPTVAVKALRPGEVVIVNFNSLNVPQDSGGISVQVNLASSGERMTEITKWNNAFEFADVHSGALADLVPTGISYDEGTATVTIKNNGAAAPAFKVGIFGKAEKAAPETKEVERLAAGGETQISADFNEADAERISVIVDIEGAVHESDRSNNVLVYTQGARGGTIDQSQKLKRWDGDSVVDSPFYIRGSGEGSEDKRNPLATSFLSGESLMGEQVLFSDVSCQLPVTFDGKSQASALDDYKNNRGGYARKAHDEGVKVAFTYAGHAFCRMGVKFAEVDFTNVQLEAGVEQVVPVTPGLVGRTLTEASDCSLSHAKVVIVEKEYSVKTFRFTPQVVGYAMKIKAAEDCTLTLRR